MWVCVLCHFPVEADDVWLPLRSARCICRRCAAREVADEHRVPPKLRRDANEAAAAATWLNGE